MKKTIKIILIIICLGVFLFSVYNIYNYLAEEYANKKLNDELLEKAVVEVPYTNTDDTNTLESENYSVPISVDFSALKQENKDIVGWIYSENTSINYPVVQSDDNEHYLRRLINGEYNIAGSIFMDYRSNPNLEDKNTIIYGHNMKNDTMFGSLQEYKSQEYYNNHKIIYYFTPEESYVLKLFAGCTVSVESDIYTLSDINTNDINKYKAQSDFKCNVEINEEDKILILSTCAYEYEGARYIVMGVLDKL